LTVLAAAKLFYFQQQVTAGAACSAASQTFALGNKPYLANIRTWQCALLHKHSHLAIIKWPVSAKPLRWEEGHREE